MGDLIGLGNRSTRNWWLNRIRQDVADSISVLRDTKEKESGVPVLNLALLPIDLSALTALLGLRIEEVEELGGIALGNPWAERDVRVTGEFNRSTRVITVTRREPLGQRRFSVAHEIAHAIYDSGLIHLRERAAKMGSSRASRAGQVRDRVEERVADMFATELLMPVELTVQAMTQRFGGPIDTTLPHDDLEHLSYALSVAARRKIDARRLATMPQLERAVLFAVAGDFKGRIFSPLVEAFRVSPEAMARRLLELSLLS